MEISSSALNVAHQQHRRAEAHIRYDRFDDAIECHKKASQQLEEAKKLTKVAKALQSLQLQQDFHNSQEDVIRLKKSQFETYTKAAENQRQKMIKGLVRNQGPCSNNSKDDENSSLQLAIYRTMEEADSLMEYLVKVRLGDNVEEDSCKSDCQNTINHDITSANSEWSKRPKDDRTVIEELHTLNQQLRLLVVQLVTQLDAKTRESDELRERVNGFLANEVHGTSSATVCSTDEHKKNLHIVTDSPGNSSPFIFSPCSELSPEVHEPHVPRVLPILAPLEMPDFDFSGFLRRPDEDI